MNSRRPIRVLSVDDSTFFRSVLTDILGRRSDIELVGRAIDAHDARNKLLALPIDVLTLNLDFSRMTGMSFLRFLMERKPMPVIVLSAPNPHSSQTAVEALIAGAFDVIEKPETLSGRHNFSEKLISGITSAATAPIRRPRHSPLVPPVPHFELSGREYDERQIIALGASTGGTEALLEVLGRLPANLPGIVIVQHIPSGFSARFAERLNKLCALEVHEAKDGDVVRSGLALLAPGDRHMEVRWARDHYRIRLHAGPAVEHQRPSVDVLFNSLAACAGPHAVAALLTGMGHDGAAGMKRLHDIGARTIAQDADSSVVFGMARRAVELKAVHAVVSLEAVAGEILRALEQHQNRPDFMAHI